MWHSSNGLNFRKLREVPHTVLLTQTCRIRKQKELRANANERASKSFERMVKLFLQFKYKLPGSCFCISINILSGKLRLQAINWWSFTYLDCRFDFVPHKDSQQSNNHQYQVENHHPQNPWFQLLSAPLNKKIFFIFISENSLVKQVFVAGRAIKSPCPFLSWQS